jgi:hypothetical protein
MYSDESNPCMHDVFNEKWRNRMMEDVQRIEERSAEFNDTMDEYLRTLNIIMPSTKHFTTLKLSTSSPKLLSLSTVFNNFV